MALLYYAQEYISNETVQTVFFHIALMVVWLCSSVNGSEAVPDKPVTIATERTTY